MVFILVNRSCSFWRSILDECADIGIEMHIPARAVILQKIWKTKGVFTPKSFPLQARLYGGGWVVLRGFCS